MKQEEECKSNIMIAENGKECKENTMFTKKDEEHKENAMVTVNGEECKESTTFAVDSEEYKEITACDLRTLFPYFEKSISKTCDYTLGCTFLWADYFSYRYCVKHGFLVIRGETENFPYYLYPWGEGNFDALMEDLKEETLSKHLPLVFAVVPDEEVERLSGYAPHSAVLRNRDWCDYLYLADDLIQLPGKKYHGQKNQINKFNAEQTVRFSPITTQNMPKIKQFFDSLPQKEGERESEKEYEKEYEKEHIFNLFDNWDKALQTGAHLEIVDPKTEQYKTIGFCVGEVIGDTLFVHVEKADRNVRGAYAALGNLFVTAVKNVHPTLTYVNREDDLGLIGLRKSKTDLHPIKLLEKPNVVLTTCPDKLAEWTKLSADCEI